MISLYQIAAMIRIPLESVGTLLPKIFANEKLVSDVPFTPKKQYEDKRLPWDDWLLGKSTPEERRAARKRWMDNHYCGETHPIDL